MLTFAPWVCFRFLDGFEVLFVFIYVVGERHSGLCHELVNLQCGSEAKQPGYFGPRKDTGTVRAYGDSFQNGAFYVLPPGLKALCDLFGDLYGELHNRAVSI